jgi:hypothetical protein
MLGDPCLSQPLALNLLLFRAICPCYLSTVICWMLEHLQLFELSPGRKSGYKIRWIGCKKGVRGNIFPVAPPAFALERR